MRKPSFQLILLGVAALLASCSRTSDLEKSLGDYRFIGLMPQLKVRILKREVVKPTSEYGRPTFRLTGVIQQNGEFPVASYIAQIKLVVKASGKNVGTCFISAPIEAKSAAFTEEVYLGESAGKSPTGESLKIEIEDFGWYPKRDGQKDVSLEISK